MSDFWLGAFVALSCWQFVNTLLTLSMRGKTVTYTAEHAIKYGVFTLFWLTLTVLLLVVFR